MQELTMNEAKAVNGGFFAALYWGAVGVTYLYRTYKIVQVSSGAFAFGLATGVAKGALGED